MEEISREGAVEISPITVRTRLMRVRALLRQQLSAYIEDLSASG